LSHLTLSLHDALPISVIERLSLLPETDTVSLVANRVSVSLLLANRMVSPLPVTVIVSLLPEIEIVSLLAARLSRSLLLANRIVRSEEHTSELQSRVDV